MQDVAPTILVEMRYNTAWNFLGRKVKGYNSNICYLTREAAQALKLVQEKLDKEGLSLLVFDCYRPQCAVDDFLAWMRERPRTDEDLVKLEKMKPVFYPNLPRANLAELGYLARTHSGHSSGSTVDLTIVKKSRLAEIEPEPLSDPNLRFGEEYKIIETDNDRKTCTDTEDIEEKTGQLDMGTIYDCFSPESGNETTELTPEQSANREKLNEVMSLYRFEGYADEWWHFKLTRDLEPYRRQYFNFTVSSEREVCE